MHSEKNVRALRELKKVFEKAGLPPMKIRKVNGIFNAIEMQIEDDDYSGEVVTQLLNALKTQMQWLGLEAFVQEADKAVSHLIGVLGPNSPKLNDTDSSLAELFHQARERCIVNSDSTDILAALVSKALVLGADGLEVEYKDRHEEVTATKGSMGVGIAALRSNSKEAINLRDELRRHRKKMKKIEIGGVNYELKVSVFDSFGETGFRVHIRRA